ncbi:MAG: hypothetical protein V5A55_09425 [Halovenus sp.]
MREAREQCHGRVDDVGLPSLNYDAIVMGESDPSVKTLLFGTRAEQVAEQFLGPVFVIQHGTPDDGDRGDGNATAE